MFRMRKESTVQNLLDTSAQNQLSYIPHFVQGRFGKPFSKEEIKGWSSGQSIHAYRTEGTGKTTLQALKLKMTDQKIKKSSNLSFTGRYLRKNEIKSANESQVTKHFRINSFFKTFAPDIRMVFAENEAVKSQQQKIDFIKGKKLQYPQQKPVTALKPLPQTLSSKKAVQKTKTKYPQSANKRDSIRSRRKKIAISLICYPIENSSNYAMSDDKQQNKVDKLVRKCKNLNI